MPEQNKLSFHFNFWKEHVWVWTLLLPLGVVCWGMPIAMLFALAAPNVPEGARIFMALVLIGVPAYLVGYIFVYNFVEGIFTRVTLTDEKVSFRTPWVIFPVFLVTKHVPLVEIEQVRLMVPHGMGRFTVLVTYQQDGRRQAIHLPQFKNSQYIQAMKALQERVEPASIPAPSTLSEDPQRMLAAKSALLNAKRLRSSRPHFVEKILNALITFSVFATVGVSGWITLSLPISSKADAFAVGFGVASTCFWLALCGLLPVVGQVAFWFLGYPVIRAVAGFFKVPDVSWDTPTVVNQFLARLGLAPIHSTLVEFIFWAVLVISIEISLSCLLAWLRRRMYKQTLQSPGAVESGQ
jgi:hypothetical protein